MAHQPISCERCHVSPSVLRIDAMPYMPSSLRAAVNNKLYPRHGYICRSCGGLFHAMTVSAFFSISEVDTIDISNAA
jgi:hypothetical protein